MLPAECAAVRLCGCAAVRPTRGSLVLVRSTRFVECEPRMLPAQLAAFALALNASSECEPRMLSVRCLLDFTDKALWCSLAALGQPPVNPFITKVRPDFIIFGLFTFRTLKKYRTDLYLSVYQK